VTLNPQNKGFYCFFAFLAAAHISRKNCAEMAYKAGQPAYEIFSKKRTFLTT